MLWVILLFANGTVLLVFNQTVVANIFTLQLPAAPLTSPVVMHNKVPIPALLNGSELEIPVLGRALITVEYVPRVRAVDGVIAFNVTNGTYIIWAQGGVVLLPTLKILNYSKFNNSILMVAQGPGTLAYTLQGVSLQTPAPNSTSTNTAPPSSQQTSSTTSAPPSGSTAPSQSTTSAPSPSGYSNSSQQTSNRGPPTVDLFIVGLIATAGVAGASLYLARRGKGGIAGLSDTDRLILSYIQRTGGAFESDVAKTLGLPRTTVFRAVRRLEQAGLVSVEKRDGRNFIVPK
ncbi:helix-turn-helix transcriptional regulator [Thermoproteus tenax]|uniref:Predicted membrane-associated trancriptional regulator n=1 Tax=Thermoproteus tenax (strain ATCC 35583 / DSM 2078 / JCM 9277 / NBRC 100435 / Kra 1) TaxID=768679 RepID=G4RMV6_THETK|nr:winged helix-turn-helix transcriptional regulator [Thermoproteus tenax]CCC80900.1 predicted membrane-associated trancriptional regulator [Thermoproteus tenax Kra 1]